MPADVKQRRLEELITVFREEAARANEAMVGQSQLVLVEGVSVPGAELSCSPLAGQEALGLYTAIMASAFPACFPHTVLGLQDLRQTACFLQSTELSSGGWDGLETCL